jgi:hypothetical protein
VRASDDRIAMAEAHFRERLAESERKEIYLRFAVSINERCGRSNSMRSEQMIAEAVTVARGEAIAGTVQ